MRKIAAFVVLIFGLTTACRVSSPSDITDLEFRLDGVGGTLLSTGDLIDFGTLTDTATTGNVLQRAVYFYLPLGKEPFTVDLAFGIDDAQLWDGSDLFVFNGITWTNTDLIPGDTGQYTEVHVEFAGDQASDNWAIGNGVKTGSLVVTDFGTEILRVDLQATIAKTTGFLKVLMDGDVATGSTVVRAAAYRATDTGIAAALGEQIDFSGAGSPIGRVLYGGTRGGAGQVLMTGTYLSVPNDDYAVQVFFDLDDDGLLGEDEPAVIRQVTVEGNTIVPIAAADLTPAPATTFAHTNWGSLPTDGGLFVRFLAPGSGEPSGAGDLITFYVGTLVGGELSGSAVVAPGTYDLYVHVDDSSGTMANLSTFPPVWNIDSGDYVLLLSGVSVTGEISLNGGAFTAVAP